MAPEKKTVRKEKNGSDEEKHGSNSNFWIFLFLILIRGDSPGRKGYLRVRKECARQSAKVEDKVDQLLAALVDKPRKTCRGTNNAKVKDVTFNCCVGPTVHEDEEF